MGMLATNPADVAVGAATIYVADYGANAVLLFDLDGYPITFFAANNPYGLSLSADSHIYVCNGNGGSVDEYTLDGTFVRSFYGSGFNSTSPNFTEPFDVIVDGSNNLWVVDAGNSQVYKVDQTDTILAVGYGTVLNSPCDAAIDQFGNVYVSDLLNDRIVKFNSSLAFVKEFGKGGYGITTNGKFFHPEGLAFDKDGNLLVSDCGNKRVQKVTPSGVFIQNVVNSGTYDWPWFVVTDPDNNVYISDNHLGIVNKYTGI
jgi:streptogramin lyase